MKKRKILIIEEKRIVAEDIKTRLQKLGYKVPGIVYSGEEAVKKAGDIRPDLVLMDIVLEGKIDGTEVASIIRSRFVIPVDKKGMFPKGTP